MIPPLVYSNTITGQLDPSHIVLFLFSQKEFQVSLSMFIWCTLTDMFIYLSIYNMIKNKVALCVHM